MKAIEFTCPRCGNKDLRYIGYKNGKPYCRKCITFQGAECNLLQLNSHFPTPAPTHLEYELSEDQIILSNTLLTNFKNKTNSLVHAVCGSGKTEIVLKIISYAISNGLKVGFAVPRRDVAIELYDRFKKIFLDNEITLVYGGHTKILFADFIICTTHQLYRYPGYFDLLVLDEVDAFPFHGSDVLYSLFKKSIRGNYVLMSATPSEKFLENFKNEGGNVVELFSRFHKYPLPVPKIIVAKKAMIYILINRLINTYQKQHKQVFVFCPTIKICESIYSILKNFVKKCNFVHSKCKDRNKRISDFKNKNTDVLFTTAVLERGITVKDLQVIVFMADSFIYDRYSLVQIAGRAGRKKDAPEGEVTYFAEESTFEMEQSIRDIEIANKNLQNLFQKHN